jgi:excisionase family DNA binding protein
MTAVRELSGAGVKQAQIAAKVGCSQSQVSLAVRLLADAPELADAVAAGTIGLTRASAMVRERGNPPPASRLRGGGEAWPPVFLTVAEAAGKLSLHRAAVLRLIHGGKLRSLRLGRSYRIPGTEVARYLSGEPRDSGLLDVSECARILRCSAGTIYGLLHHGHLTGERSGELGQYRIPVTEFLRFLSDVPR